MNNKWITLAVAGALLFSSAAPSLAANPVTVTIHGESIANRETAPMERDGEMFIPIRPSAEALELSIRYKANTKEVYLGETIRFSAGSHQAEVNGELISFGAAAFIEKDRVYVPASFFNEILALEVLYDDESRTVNIISRESGPAEPEEAWEETPADQDSAVDAETLLETTMNLLLEGEYQTLWESYFDADLQSVATVDYIALNWDSAEVAAGEYLGLEQIQSTPLSDTMTLFSADARFEQFDFQISIVLDHTSSRFSGFLIQPALIPVEAPAEIAEEEVIVNEGGEFELGGTLTLPADAQGPVPAVVLVQGSGPSDRDESTSGYKPFRDIAWGLAKEGIAVLRYDKRTFIYGGGIFSPDPAPDFTVKDEYVDDVIAAANLLKADPRIDASQVYIVGHSQGGMMAPRIDAEGGDFAGLVLLAGTPRTLWELMYDQNMAFIEEMDDTDPLKAEHIAFIEAEYEKAKALKDMSDEEALATAPFGVSGYYLKDMDSFDAGKYVQETDKPVLVLQGEDDFQVYPDKDYVLWQELLGNQSNVTFKLYPGLNHFFVDYNGPGENTLGEYLIPGLVSEEVIQDIADWILKQ